MWAKYELLYEHALDQQERRHQHVPLERCRGKGAKGTKSAVSCQSLMLDSESRSDTIPAMDIRTKDAAIGHEAKIGAISNEAVFYLMSRGMSEEDARAMIVSGFADNVSKELPVEYAVEMNNLIRLEMKGSIG